MESTSRETDETDRGATELSCGLRGKENHYETQDQNQGRKARCQPQHHRPLTSWGLLRCQRPRSCPEKYRTSEHKKKENCMKLKTRIKAGKLAGNHNII